MPNAISTKTCSQMATLWPNLRGPLERGQLAGEELVAISADGPLTVDGAGRMLILDGLTVNGQNGHFSITGDDLGEWTYFHLTVVGSDGTSAYYALEIGINNELTVNTSAYTDIDGTKKNVSKAKYFWKDVPPDITHDVEVIMKAMIGKNYKPGEAL